MDDSLICCYPDQETLQSCPTKPVWQITDPGKHPAEGTFDACDLHVWNLLTDAEVQCVRSLDGKFEFEVRLVRALLEPQEVPGEDHE